jgi:UDP-N-acetylmuramyl pentapeptide phosphotransferase/UDP-N-acetylglucosamine-1-phosphate transferase
VTSVSTILVVCTAAFTLICGIAYRRVWARLRGPAITATGFGALLAPILLGAAIATGASLPMQAALGIVAAATAAYWFDDALGLSARLRLLISFAAGVAIGMAYFADHGGFSPLAVGLICLAAGLICLVMTNVVNFYDGADLNLATFIVLTAGLILLFGPAQPEWSSIAAAALAFTIPFAAMNGRPRTIYLGDSGSFAFAGLLTIMAAAFVRNIESVPPEAAIPAALPTLDVVFVFFVRIAEKQDLLTRNYLHLYQRLKARYEGFGYLLPQLANIALCLLAAAALQAAGLGRILSVIAAMLLVTIPFYFGCRRIFLEGKAARASQPSS